MLIKKLTIHGFKSFADRTVLTFSPGTSAIVGPNGCGKSNVVDAIRWVIGEQNARHLRGKSMEDIIFSGTEARKATGMAEVVMTLCNEAGTAPTRFAGYTEVEVARRLYRSGESEYYINKVQCRMKDVADLFTDTGIGTRAYSIIEQGQVGWLVNAKPVERRVLFEEAAGINKYKQKKDMAIRRLSSTRDNLDRVNDIVSEVKRQLNSLNRQAKKAERYKVFKDELRGIDLYLSHLEYGEKRDLKASLDKRLAEVTDREVALSTDINGREARKESLQERYLEGEIAYKEMREKGLEIERTLQGEERTSEIAGLRIEELMRAEARLGGEIGELESEGAALKGEIESLKETVSALLEEVTVEEGRAREAEGAYNALKDELREKERRKGEEESEIVRGYAGVSDMGHAISVVLRDEERLKEREVMLTSSLESFRKELGEMEGPMGTLLESIDGAVERRGSVEGDLARSRADLEAIEAERAGKEEEVRGLKEEHAKGEARLHTLEEMESSLENLKEGVRGYMEGVRDGGTHAILADVIEPRNGCDRAVEAVLGERLQYVIVESQREGIEAIDYLKSNAKGRGSFLPLSEVRNPLLTGSADMALRGEYGVALAEEVTVKEGYRGVVDYLLGDVMVVSDLTKAVELWQRNGVVKTYVTRDGEIVDPQGVISGGSSGSGDGGILQKRREIADLKERLAESKQRVMEFEGEIEGKLNLASRTKILLEEYRDKLHRADIDKVNLENDLKKFEEDFERLKERIASSEAELGDIRDELLSIGTKKATLSGERTELEESLEELEAGVRGLNSEIEGVTKSLEERASVLTEVKVSLASKMERLERFKSQRDEKVRLAEETVRRISARRTEIEGGLREIEAKRSEIESLKVKIEELLAARESMRVEEVRKEEALSEINEELKRFDKGLRELKGDLDEALKSKNSLSLERSEVEMSLGNLKEKTLERYGVEVESYEPPEDITTLTEGADLEVLDERRRHLREKIGAMGEVSLSALEEFKELEERYSFLVGQQEDLNKAIESLQSAISRINRTTRDRFRKTFEAINEEFKQNFPRFFNGGRAELQLEEGGDVLEAGIEIIVQPPGKKLQNITLLSGGEKALTATALIFSIFLIKPSPFCLLDEVDAPLDDANIDRFNGFVREMSKKSQFILITHNKRTMEMADTLYGITMEEPGATKILSVEL